MEYITKEEAKKILYDFLRRTGLATRYYYNCIYHNDTFSQKRIYLVDGLAPKLKLKKIMKDHVNKYQRANLEQFFSGSEHSFAWLSSEEGFGFWSDAYAKWEKEISKKYPNVRIKN